MKTMQSLNPKTSLDWMLYNIKEIRLQKQLTYQQLSKQADLDPAHYWRIETGQVCPSAFTICKIADALGVPPRQLFTPGISSPSYRVIKTACGYGIREEETAVQIDDISADYTEISRLAQLYTARGLDPEQLEDAVQDYLCGILDENQ